MAESGNNVSVLFSDLNKYGKNGDYFRALKVANKILQLLPNDPKALHCKVVCLIQESKFQDALSIVQKNKSQDLNLVFEKVYCLYRLNRINEALDVLNSIQNPSVRENELKAQILYRLELYDDCFEVYRNLIKDSEDDYEEERETNLAAVISNMMRNKKNQTMNVPKVREHTYELCYNSACILLSRGKVIEAVAKLKQAQELCRKTLEEDDVPEDEIESEVSIVRTQLGYALQLLRKNDEALNMYNQVMKQRPTDVALTAVTSNNIVSINKDQNVFDSKKRMKQATADVLEHKLSSEQRFSILLNQCLLSFHTNQQDMCKQQVKSLKENYPDAVEPLLILAAQLAKEKQTKKATEMLKDYGKMNQSISDEITLSLAQLLLSQGKVSDTCETLNTMGTTSYRLGVVSTLVALNQRLGNRNGASKVLKDAVEWHRRNKTNSASAMKLIQASARFHLRNGDPQAAAKCLEELRKVNKSDTRILAQLINAYSQFDPEKSQQISKEMPRFEAADTSIDVDSLESSHWSLGARYIKKVTKTEPSPASGTRNLELIQKAKKKRKKGKLPKNYDPSVDPDPERWLPRKERSTYRKKKDKRNQGVGKGTQGAAASGASDNLDASKSTFAAAANTSPAPGTPASPRGVNSTGGPVGPRQQRPQPTQKKRKKKGSKW